MNHNYPMNNWFYRKKEDDRVLCGYDEKPRKLVGRKAAFAALLVVGTALLAVSLLLPAHSMDAVVGIVLTAIGFIAAIYLGYTTFFQMKAGREVLESVYEIGIVRFRLASAVYAGIILLNMLVTAVWAMIVSFTLADILVLICEFVAFICIGSIFFIEVNRPMVGDDDEEDG